MIEATKKKAQKYILMVTLDAFNHDPSLLLNATQTESQKLPNVNIVQPNRDFLFKHFLQSNFI